MLVVVGAEVAGNRCRENLVQTGWLDGLWCARRVCFRCCCCCLLFFRKVVQSSGGGSCPAAPLYSYPRRRHVQWKARFLSAKNHRRSNLQAADNLCLLISWRTISCSHSHSLTLPFVKSNVFPSSDAFWKKDTQVAQAIV